MYFPHNFWFNSRNFLWKGCGKGKKNHLVVCKICRARDQPPNSFKQSPDLKNVYGINLYNIGFMVYDIKGLVRENVGK